jgi:hypothetical protein
MIEFAAHTVTLNADNLEFSGDFAHYTREFAAAALGAPVMYVNGPEGDVSPTPIEGEGFERPRGYGEKTALFAVEMMKEQEQLSGDIYVETKHFEHPLSNPLFLAAFKSGLKNRGRKRCSGGGLFATSGGIFAHIICCCILTT